MKLGSMKIFLMFISSLSIWGQLSSKTIEVFTKNSFASNLKYFLFSIVHFYNDKNSPNNVLQSKIALKEASEFAQFIKSDLGFISVNLDTGDLGKVYKNYNPKKSINLYVIYQKKSPYKVDDKVAKIEFKDNFNEKNIRKFVVANLQNHIDQIIDKKEPINSAKLKALLSNIKIKAFLDTIAYCEGAFKPDGYRLKYMGAYFESFHDHPRTVSCGVINGKTFC